MSCIKWILKSKKIKFGNTGLDIKCFFYPVFHPECKSEFIMIDELSLHADINKDDSEIKADSEMNEDFMPITMFGK